MLKSYFPSTGSEGDAFEQEHCLNCAKPKPCKIFEDAFYLGAHPAEWVYDNGMPTCLEKKDVE